jgi:hypothetical protein
MKRAKRNGISGVRNQVRRHLGGTNYDFSKSRLPLVALQLALMVVVCISLKNVIYIPPAYAEREKIGKFSSDDYQQFVETAVRILAKGDERGLRSMLSPSMVSRSESELGKAKVDLMIRQQFLGFFEDFHHLSANVHSTKTYDAAKRPGLAIFRSFLNGDGEEKPFVMYVIEENDELVLGNILINKTLRDVSNLVQSRKLP